MASDEKDEIEKLLETVRRAVGPLPNQMASSSTLSLKDLRVLLETQNKAAADRGDREERQAIRDKEEREAERKAGVEAENRKHMRIALYGASVAIVLLVAFFYAKADAAQRSKISDQSLTAIFGIITGAVGFFFGSKDKDKKG